MRLADFKAASCPKDACWKQGKFEDGGVTVDLGQNWHFLMLDEHFRNAHNCLGKGKQKGNFCDAVAIHQDDSNRRIRLIEAKRDAKVSSKAKRQLQRGADYVDKVVPTRHVQFTAELHTLPQPAITVRPKASVEIPSRRLRIPIIVCPA